MIPRRRTVIKILGALKIEADDLMGGIEWIPPGKPAPARGRWMYGPLPQIPAHLSSRRSKEGT